MRYRSAYTYCQETSGLQTQLLIYTNNKKGENRGLLLFCNFSITADPGYTAEARADTSAAEERAEVPADTREPEEQAEAQAEAQADTRVPEEQTEVRAAEVCKDMPRAEVQA